MGWREVAVKCTKLYVHFLAQGKHNCVGEAALVSKITSPLRMMYIVDANLSMYSIADRELGETQKLHAQIIDARKQHLSTLLIKSINKS
jgi:hypothetical protein